MGHRPDADQSEKDLPPPPPEAPWAYLRRRWLSQGRRRGLQFWLLFRGSPILAAYFALFAVNGVLIGWREAYDVSLAIESPAVTTHPVAAWLLSVAGWLIAPGVAGAVAGYVITSSIESRRRMSAARLFREDDDG